MRGGKVGVMIARGDLAVECGWEGLRGGNDTLPRRSGRDQGKRVSVQPSAELGVTEELGVSM